MGISPLLSGGTRRARRANRAFLELGAGRKSSRSGLNGGACRAVTAKTGFQANLDVREWKGSEPALDQFTANSRMMAFSRTRPLSVAAIRLPEFKISPKLLKFATLVVSSGLPAIAS